MDQSFTLVDGGAASLAVNGLNAATVSLTAPAITVPGALAGTTSVTLAATGGGISETGAVTTPLLTGSAAGTVDLSGTNAIAAVGASAAAPFDAVGQSFTLVDGGAASLAVNGLSAATVSLTAPVISVPGALTGTTSVALAATGGGISETGTVTTPLLTGGAAGTVDLTGTNAIAALGASAASPFSAGGQSFTLVDDSAASLAVNGLSAATVSLTAPEITVPGALAGTTSVTLAATGGGISGTGAVTTPLLTGSAAGTVDLSGTNAIAAVGASAALPFSAVGQSFTLVDGGAASLAVNGLGAATVSLTAPVISIPGALSGTTSVALVATAGGINETGTVTTPLLTGGAAGTVDLTGTNTIAALGASAASPFSAVDQSFTLVDGGAASLTVNGLSAATVSLTAPEITVPGALAGTTSVTLAATGGGISETGTLTTPLLSGSAAGTVALTGTNAIAAVGASAASPFSAVGQSFTLVDAGAASLAVNGLSAATVDLTALAISIPGALSGTTSVALAATESGISETGAVTTPLLTGSSAGTVDLSGTNTVAALGASAASPFSAVGQSFTLVDGRAASLTVNGLSAATVSLTAPVVSIPGALIGTTSVAVAATGGGISETGAVTTPLLTGSAAGTVDLTGSNTIDALGASAASPFDAVDQSFTLVDGGAASLAVNGLSAATVSLTAPVITVPGVLTGTTSVALAATGGGISGTGTVTTPLLIGSASGTVGLTGANQVTDLGDFTTGGDFALTDAGALTVVGAVAAGTPAAPNAGNTATLTLSTGGALQIGVDGGAAGSLNAGNVALTAGGAITEPNGSIATNSLVASTTGTGGDVSLTSISNQISASTGISATNGSVILVDDPTLVLTGNYTGANLFFEVAAAGDGIALGDAVTPATLTVPLGGRISLVADNITATAASQITAPSGRLELAPFSAIPVSVAGSSGAGQLLLDATLLSDINTGTSTLNTLLIGAFTNIPAGATAAATSASRITIDGAVDLTNSTANLGLFANGPITEPGGPLAVFNVFGTTSVGGGDFALSNAGNAITESTGITATNGDVVVVDGTNLTLIGTHTGNNLFYEIAAATDTLTLGAARRPATLTTASGGRASLVADNIVGNNGSVIAASGTVELAPFSAINTSLFGASGLVISPGLVSIIATSTLVAGGFTNVPGGATTSAPSASTVTVDAAVDLTGVASTLEVEATGAITEPGGPLTVATLEGSGGSVQLLNAANKLATLGTLTATTGDLSLADASPVTIDGAVTAFGNVYLTAPGSIAVAATGSIGASSTGRVSLQTDAASIAGPITGGTFEFAPFTGGGTVALGTSGDLASLIGVTVGSARIGAVTLPGGVAPTTTAGAITTVGTFDANNLPVELDATGAIAGAAFPIINVATLSGSAGAVTLDDANNTVANLGNFVATSFSLADAIDLSVIGTVAGGSSATITDAGSLTIVPGGTVQANAVGLTAGNITIAGLVSDGGAGTTSLVANAGTISETGTLVAGTLSGSATDAASLTGANQIGTLGNFTASGLTLSDQTDLRVTGAVDGGASATLLDAGALTIASGGTVSATAVDLVATNITIPGVVTDGGSGTVVMIANGGTISETGGLTAGTLSGSATGAASLTGTNQVAALGDFTASNFVLADAADLLIGGTLNAANIAIRAPANQVSLGDGATIVVGGTVRPAGPIEAALEPANGGPGAYIQAASFTQINSSTVIGQGGGPATVQISVAGNMQFDPPLGLEATGTWLILDLTNGTAGGNVFVNALDVSYTVPGSTNLFGTINDVLGGPAAAIASIQPSIDVNYLFNGCVIAAATCQLLTSPPPPPPLAPPPTPTPPVALAPPNPPAIVTPPPSEVFTLSNEAVTSALGGLFSFLPGSPPPLIELPNLVLVVAPMLPAPPRQLTDPDVVPPNISYLDY